MPLFLGIGGMKFFGALDWRSGFDSEAKNRPLHPVIGDLFRKPDSLAVHQRDTQAIVALFLQEQSTLAGHWRYTGRRSNPLMVITPDGSKKEWTFLVRCKG